ncbi:MAG: 50S ribosomal protein L6 [Candidatus Latescibacterota bacterium]|nr:MAG: 50S ribosomal protein L6 [Candidatus Latescibacterota bacterium]
MSRVGLQPIDVPKGVTVTMEGSTATVKGPKGTITRALPSVCRYDREGDTIKVSRESEDRNARSMHGLARTLLSNMVIGVTDGFVKELEIVGVGYRAELKGKDLVLSLGYSHPINFPVPEGITIEVPAPTQIKVNGIIKEQVGQVAADIRKCRPPEPYKGKGIKYVGEYIQRKAGKAAVGT